MVQWLGLHASIAGCESSNPNQRIKIRHASWHSQKTKKKILYFSNVEKRSTEIKLITIRIEFLMITAWFMGQVTLYSKIMTLQAHTDPLHTHPFSSPTFDNGGDNVSYRKV